MAERAYGMLAEFDSPETLKSAAKRARDAGYQRLDAFTPFPVEGLARVLRLPRPNISWVGLIGGLAGIACHAHNRESVFVSYGSQHGVPVGFVG